MQVLVIKDGRDNLVRTTKWHRPDNPECNAVRMRQVKHPDRPDYVLEQLSIVEAAGMEPCRFCS